MKKIIALAICMAIATITVTKAGDEPKFIMTGFVSKNFKAGGVSYPSTYLGFGIGSTFAKDAMFIELDMKPKDRFSYEDENDSIRFVKMSTLVLRMGWNIKPERSALLAGPVIGPQAGYNFTEDGDKDLMNNPYFAGLFIQFNLNYPDPIPIRDNDIYVGFFIRPSYNFVMNTKTLTGSDAKFHYGVDFGIHVLLNGKE